MTIKEGAAGKNKEQGHVCELLSEMVILAPSLKIFQTTGIFTSKTPKSDRWRSWIFLLFVLESSILLVRMSIEHG